MFSRAAAAVYYRVRRAIAWSADRVTHWCDQQVRATYRLRPPWLQRAACRTLLAVGSLARIPTLFPRVDAMLIVGPAWRVAYLGDAILSRELVQTLFPDGATVETLPRVAAWRVPHHAERLHERADLVVCGLPERWPRAWRPRAAPWSAQCPVFVQMVTQLTGDTFDQWSRGRARKRLRRDILVAARVPFVARTTRAFEDLVRFHEELYLPHLRHRHGDDALTSTARSQWRDWIARGAMLLLLELDGEPVAGVILGDFGEVRFLGEEGVSPRVRGTAAGASAQVALKAHAISGAFARGLRQVDLGRSLARTSDRGFVHKQRWMAHPMPPQRSYYPIWNFFAHVAHPALTEHLESLGLLDLADLTRCISPRSLVRPE
jgi:hypothetical protein